MYFTASDDIPQQGIKEAVSFLKQNSDINFVIGGAINFFETGVTLPTYTNNHRNFFNLKPLQQYKALFLNYPHPILIQSTVFKTEALTKLGGWDPTMKLDDYAIFIKLLTSNIKHNIKTAFMPDIICVHYRHHSSNSYKNTLKLFYMVRELLLKECPAYLINKSLGNITSYYLFCALRSKDREAVYAIIKAGNLTIYFNTLLTTFHKMVNKITK